MSSYTAADFTDDEDSYQTEDEHEHSSEFIEKSVGEKELVISDSDVSEKQTTSHRRKKNGSTSSFRSPSNTQLSSESSEDERNLPSTSKLSNSQSDSDTEIGKKFRAKTKKNVILSDSDSESEFVNVKCSIQCSSSSEELSLHSIENISDSEITKLAGQLNNSRISSEFDFGKTGNIINSTILDTENQPSSPKVSTKRSLNKSVDTPRILKHMKESSTPRIVPSVAKNFVTPKISQQDDPLMTPRNIKEVISSRSPSSSSSVEVLSEDDDVIDVSSEEVQTPVKVVPPRPNKFVKQTTLDSLVIKKTMPCMQPMVKQEFKMHNVLEVPPREFEEQKEKIRKMESDLLKAKNLLRTVNLPSLPDKGKLIMDRHLAIQQMLKYLRGSLFPHNPLETRRDQRDLRLLFRIVNSLADCPLLLQSIGLGAPLNAVEDDPLLAKPDNQNKVPITWAEIEANAATVLPKTFGKKAMSTYDAQKAVTMDRLQQLHGSLKDCPSEDTLAKDPKGLIVELMPHQKRALAWLMWREKQKPSGGILADDMGLGKTLTMISLMLKTNEERSSEDEQSDDENRPERSSYKFNGGTLVVCPASLINQWSGELERRTKRGLASFVLYHGPKRESKAKRLAEYDMVITTYSIVMNECERKGTIFRVKWRRIVIDEAHQIRNHKSLTSIAVCHLAAKSRWALTGTPVHNKELDMYGRGGTKAELIEKGALMCMPERKWELIEVQLNKNEMDVYQKILIFSRTLFAQFLHQRAEKNQDALDLKYVDNISNQANGPNQEYFKMRQKLLHLNKVKDIKQHEILVLLLRLRQICCHPSLITGMLHENMEELGDDYNQDESEELNLLDQLNNLSLGGDDEYKPNLLGQPEGENAGLKEAAKGFLNPANPVFSKERASSKIKVVLDVLKERILRSKDKAIIVSQWPGFLRLIAYHLKEEGIAFEQLDGTVPVNKRMIMVDKFNNPNDKMKILLLSLTAGGVGLNLIGANHLFLLDLHWNPQLENQAQDRIYRVGQEKPVFVYKFMATDTIEKRILDLQEKKIDIANSMLTGSKQVIGTKLSLQDLKLLFDM
ncbi:hypothetical protein NQ314_005315 [Rhamnusium bicolor]|uniref:Transcription termination factor 2 n=1 Tax=Rhamnusium bicolor TaxID=1586634 RepID=A0AAV8ZGU5_9CUCU|nr:hypothetical protein NQ314_005315 [Rhamnusium bicolor]